MIGLLCFALAVLASPFKSKLRLEAENATLRHQLIVLRRRLDGRVRPKIPKTPAARAFLEHRANSISGRNRERPIAATPSGHFPKWEGASGVGDRLVRGLGVGER